LSVKKVYKSYTPELLHFWYTIGSKIFLMISISDFENSKENFQSLKQGRKLQDLKEINNEKERKEREKRLNDHSSFEDFVAYIDWTNQHFPAGHGSVLRKTELACRLFRKDSRYKNHPRYVELWLSVLKHQQDPTELFKYLIKNEIGLELAQFYEQYAGFYESCKRLEEADKVFRLGISRKAIPVDKLIRLYNDFLLRRGERYDNEQDTKPPLILEAPKMKASKSTSKAASFQVFQGDDGFDEQDHLFPCGSTGDYQGLSHEVKENEPNRDKWAGSTLKVAHRNGSTYEKVSVYRDNDEEQNVQSRKKAKVLHGKESENSNSL
jgi:hypothetical protein